jgi:hypothetical protein
MNEAAVEGAKTLGEIGEVKRRAVLGKDLILQTLTALRGLSHILVRPLNSFYCQ